MKNSTLEALAQFSRIEKDLTSSVLPESSSGEAEYAPSTTTVQNILNYSKALSVRKSERISNMFIVLN